MLWLGSVSAPRVESSQANDAKAASERKKAVRAATMLGKFGDYELLEEIGAAVRAWCFRARQKSLNRTVALKSLAWAGRRKPTEALSPGSRSRREPGSSDIVPIYEVGEREGPRYFSMKFVEGGQLDEAVRREPMPIAKRRNNAKLARTVHYAHEHGILHRDIKPGNILLDAKANRILPISGWPG